MVKYDASVIHEFASRLYTKAGWIWIRYATLGLVVGFIGMAALSRIGLGTAESWIVVLVGVLVGASIGRERAFQLRLQAQTALCQAAIEENTRTLLGQKAAASVPRAGPSGTLVSE